MYQQENTNSQTDGVSAVKILKNKTIIVGTNYVNTRHNIGFKVVDFFARKENITFQTAKLGDMAEFKIKGRSIFLLKPNTYMNLSGKAVKYWMEKENIAKENILVITDDLNLPYGTI